MTVGCLHPSLSQCPGRWYLLWYDASCWAAWCCCCFFNSNLGETIRETTIYQLELQKISSLPTVFAGMSL